MDKIKLIIFDIDGLILDSEQVFLITASQISKEKNYGISDETFKNCMGKTRTMIREFLESNSNENFNYDEYRKEYLIRKDAYLKLHPYELKKGVHELLDYLDTTDIIKAVATSTYRKATYEHLKGLNVIERMDYMVCGDEITRGKPDPQIYQTVLDHYNIPSENALVFEDSMNGILSATSANIKCIWCPDLSIVPEDVQSKIYKKIDVLTEGIEIIKEINHD